LRTSSTCMKTGNEDSWSTHTQVLSVNSSAQPQYGKLSSSFLFVYVTAGLDYFNVGVTMVKKVY